MGKLALSWEAWGRKTRQRRGSEATQAQDCIPAQRPPWPHISSAPCRYPRCSHDNSHVKIIPSTNLISSEKSNPKQAGWILCGFLQTRLLETPTSLFFPQILCMVLMLLLRQTCKSAIFRKRHSEDKHDGDPALLPGSASQEPAPPLTDLPELSSCSEPHGPRLPGAALNHLSVFS